MSEYGTATYGLSSYGATYDRTAAAGRVAQFLPALFTATKTNQILEDISEWMIAGQVDLDLDSDGAKMTFTAQMRKSVDLSPLSTYVAPFLKIIYEDGSYDYEQLGLYVLVPAPSTHTPAGTIYNLDGRDFCWLLDANQTPITVNDVVGDSPVAEALTALGSVGMTRRSIPATSYTYTKTVSWPPGTSRLKRINDRMQTANYYTLWFDRTGIATSRPYADLATAEPAVKYTDAPGTKIVPPIEDEPDITRLCNRAIVIGTDPAQAPIYAIRENNDLTSPTSFPNMGNAWITRTVEDPNIQTQAAANALADELLRNGSSYYRKITLQTLPDPYRNPREVYELDVSNDDGLVADGKWWCSGWSISLDWKNPVMVHSLHRIEVFQGNAG